MKHFSTDRLVSTLSYHPDWEVENGIEIENILNQPFHYYDQGGQSWVFVSDDQKWILKFFDFRLCWRDIALWLHLPNFLCPELSDKQIRSREGPVKGYAIAAKRFKNQCALTGVFLNGKQKGITSLTIDSPIHCTHVVDLSRASFVIQKKADSILSQTLPKLLEEGNAKLATALFTKTLHLIEERSSLGIADEDRWHLHHNIGFIGEEPIYLDAGTFRDNPALANSENIQAECLRSSMLLVKKMAITLP